MDTKMKEQIEAKEFSIRVPWGHVAAKAWGSPKDFPVLCAHGILDNAGAFDRLIVLLPKNFYYVSIDLPGHGLSSHFPPGIPLEFFNYVLTLRYVIDELKWKKFNFMGHSLGGQLGTFYSLIYPDQIQKMILIEGMVPATTANKNILSRVKEVYDTTLEALDDTKQYLCTHAEVMHTLQYKRNNCLNTAAAEAIFKRSVSKHGEMYKYNRDIRLKGYVKPIFNIDQMITILSNIKVKILLIFTSGTFDYLSREPNSFLSRKKINDFAASVGNIQIFNVYGNHDVHNNHPEKLEFEITKFMNENVIIKMQARIQSTLKIKVPWGHIAAKTWGNEENIHVLLVHGTLDNAGTFDRLINLLPENFYYVCIDLPGHGLSSHFPKGITLSYISYVLVIRYVLDELKWEKTHLIGHSLGAELCFSFSVIYPERINKLIMLDIIMPRSISNHEIIPKIRSIQDSVVEMSKINNTRLYTKDEVHYALENLRGCCLTTEAAEAIFERAVTKVSENAYCYNRDMRLKMKVKPMFNLDQNLYSLSQIKVETLIILATNTLPSLYKYRPMLVNVLKNYDCVNVIMVEGNHDVHNNYPERISEHISKFLLHIPSKL